MRDIKISNGDIVFNEADFASADNYQQVQNVVRNIIFTRRGSMKQNTTFGSDLLHNKAISELQVRSIDDIASYIKEDMMYSIWLTNPGLYKLLKCEYTIDEENKTIYWQFYIQDSSVFVPLMLDVGTVQTQIGIKLVFK